MAKNATIIKNRYDKKHMKQYLLKFHLVNDADIIEKLDSVPVRQDYIRQLIKQDIARTRTNTESIADEIVRTCF